MKGEIKYWDLAVEITRRCNMSCAHCMRGEAQDMDISTEVIDHLLDNVRRIENLVLTGGEPSLNVKAIDYIAQQIEARGIYLGSFYIVTNAKEVSEPFLRALLRMFSLTECREGNGIAWSHDVFHEPVPVENIRKLSVFAGFSSEDKAVDWSKGGLINVGRARNLAGFPRREKYSMELEWYREADGTVYFPEIISVTAEGDILRDCDYAYDETAEIKLGNVLDPYWLEKVVPSEVRAVPAGKGG